MWKLQHLIIIISREAFKTKNRWKLGHCPNQVGGSLTILIWSICHNCKLQHFGALNLDLKDLGSLSMDTLLFCSKLSFWICKIKMCKISYLKDPNGKIIFYVCLGPLEPRDASNLRSYTSRRKALTKLIKYPYLCILKITFWCMKMIKLQQSPHVSQLVKHSNILD